MSDLPEGGCPGHLLHLRSNGRLAQALYGEAGEGQCGDGVQEVQDHCSPGAGYGGHPADEQEEKGVNGDEEMDVESQHVNKEAERDEDEEERAQTTEEEEPGEGSSKEKGKPKRRARRRINVASDSE